MLMLQEVLDPIELAPPGLHAKGEFRCTGCGYGVVVCRGLPRCPMCNEHIWEPIAWRPFSRS
jgi:hypothetical protein